MLPLTRAPSSGHIPRSRIVHGDRPSSKLTLRYHSNADLSPPRVPLLTFIFQVLKLCGPEPLTIPIVLGVVSLQFLCAYLLRDTPFLSWRFFLTAYIIGATANQNLFLAIHEITHNLAFKSPMANRLFAIVANLPIGIPYSASFRVCRAIEPPLQDHAADL